MPFASNVYLQKRGLNFSGFTSAFMEFVAGKSGATVTDSAKFDVAKPYELDVSDDSWASLQLRVDPLARAILDPHNLYLGSVLLTALLSAVFLAVKPGFEMYNGDDDFNADDDFNDKYNNVDDFWKFRDVENNQYVYRNTAVARQRILWAVLFAVTVSSIIGITAVVAYMIESRNSRVDAFIKEVCEEVRSRFEQEGFEIQYRSRILDEGMVGHFMPERYISFRELSDDEIGKAGNNDTYQAPGISPGTSKSKRKKESSFGTINVMVPVGYKPGQVVNVMTPSGLPIMVAVPSGLQPGESFPVQIPAQMYRPRK
mmetsp:Transcript_9945/g.18675  ORF Transcript_9945/g.18675 Transcript_9945/m.18675 type:complete len:314 (+) Transcript_9945:137-1078(+)|eukprot:CAMPEP_0176493756 /NCGR_PEP_ID=MMETSP0200_2-20121128/9715_1 /TAXON_ID=947934 /ORGANISM="Chaetoceros sp., Strain GSL56" /LENGTH=313 /DNA_ID=CAMNT_0017891433 /DNA_START=64 /DNA_END=1005 /DNA_ORIENTATION=+